MNVKQVKDIVHRWVLEEASHLPGFAGAFIAGSTNWLADDAPFPTTSDVDVKIVLTDSNLPASYQKQAYQGVQIDVSYMSSDQIQSPDMILSNYYLAYHFTTPNIISDPSGQLTKIHAVVSKEFARRKWVNQRCDHARNQVLKSLQWLQESQPFHDQVFTWVYPTSTLNHVLLVAGLQNPTVRRMFAATRDLLTTYNLLPFHETLLTLLGSVDLGLAQAENHLAATVEIFNVAKEVIKTPFFGSTNISDNGRSIAIGSSQTLIERGYHREAIFGIILTHTWCQKALYNDAPTALQEQFKPAYQQLMNDLGITSPAALQQRHAQVEEYLPHVWEVAQTVMAAHPDIKE
jgi:hypothetical protein